MWCILYYLTLSWYTDWSFPSSYQFSTSPHYVADYLVSHRTIWIINNIFCIYRSTLAGTVSPVLSTSHTYSSCKVFGTEKKDKYCIPCHRKHRNHRLPPNKVHDLSQSQGQRPYLCVTVLVPCFQMRDFSVIVFILQLFFSIENLSVQCCISSSSAQVLQLTP